jgi:pimeloyl-ACP methyl ester carboxylesterase
MAEGEVRYCTTSDGIRIAYAAALGGQPAVVLVNNHPFSGIWESHRNYVRPLVERLNPKYTCVWYDGRGSGYSDRQANDFSLEARMRDLDAVLSSVGAERVILVGTAQATPTCLAWAAAHPEVLVGLVLWSVIVTGPEFYARPEIRGLVAMAQSDWGLFLQTFAHLITGWSMDECRAWRLCLSCAAAARAPACRHGRVPMTRV